MECIVNKTGLMHFDVAHAYGLCLFLFLMTQAPVQLIDEGPWYRIKSTTISRQMTVQECITSLLAIPSLEALKLTRELTNAVTLSMCILDGLLAILFTSLGARTLSVHDMFDRARSTPAVIDRSFAKASAAIERWMKNVEWLARQAPDWMDHVLSFYHVEQPAMPIPIVKRKHSIVIPMTIEPGLSYSTRRPISDGIIGDKHNISLEHPPYAAILAIVGAARFLRAHRVAENFVLLYLPIAEVMVISADTALPVLKRSSQAVDHTIVKEWLERRCEQVMPEARWAGLAYQLLCTQGAQQSISLSCGYLDYKWLETIEHDAGPDVIRYWCQLLCSGQVAVTLERDNLIDTLLHRRATSWMEHLNDMAQQPYQKSGLSLDSYHVSEVTEITKAMCASTTNPLRIVLERNQGTLRIGHALRLLRRFSQASLRDLIDKLDAVHDCERLLRIVAEAAQECELAAARTQFMIVPDEDDLAYLLDDVEQYGTRMMASMLITLSALRYPATELANSTQSMTTDGEPIEQETKA